MNREYFMNKRRNIMAVVGVIIGSVNIGLFKMAAFGMDPFQSLVCSLDKLLPISYGTTSMLLTAALLIFTLLADRHYIGITTAVNLFFLGYIAQFTQDLLESVLPQTMAVRVIVFIVGFVGLCLGSAIYITADRGVSTYDSVSIIMDATWHWGKFKYLRICTDLVCVTGSFLLYRVAVGSFQGLGAVIGFGTIATAFCMGPLVDFFIHAVAEPMLYGKGVKRA